MIDKDSKLFYPLLAFLGLFFIYIVVDAVRFPVNAGPPEPTQVVPMPKTETFERLEKSLLVEDEKLVVWFFCADWCEPCRKAKPAMKRVAPHVDLQYIDYDENKELARSMGVTTLPTFIVFEDGEEVARETSVVGLVKVLSLLLKIVI